MPGFFARRAKQSIDNGPPVNEYVNPGISMFKRTGSLSLIRMGDAPQIIVNEFCSRFLTPHSETFPSHIV